MKKKTKMMSPIPGGIYTADQQTKIDEYMRIITTASLVQRLMEAHNALTMAGGSACRLNERELFSELHDMQIRLVDLSHKFIAS